LSCVGSTKFSHSASLAHQAESAAAIVSDIKGLKRPMPVQDEESARASGWWNRSQRWQVVVRFGSAVNQFFANREFTTCTLFFFNLRVFMSNLSKRSKKH